MSNSRLQQFFYTKRAAPVQIDLKIPIGATGAVGTVVGPGVTSVTRTAAGVYKILFADDYNALLNFYWSSVGPSAGTGSSVPDGSFSVGTTYVITAVGNTTWSDLPSGITAAVGMVFTATVVGGAGTGTAKAVAIPGITQIQLLGAGLTLYSTTPSTGGTQYIRCLAPTNSSTTTLVATDPTNTEILYLTFLFSNSSLSPSIQ